MEIFIILKLEKQCQDPLPKFIQTQEQMQTLMRMPRPLQLQMQEQMPKHIHLISMVRTLDLMFQSLLILNNKEQILDSMLLLKFLVTSHHTRANNHKHKGKDLTMLNLYL